MPERLGRMLVGLGLLCWMAVSGASSFAAERPNVVFILADDLGWGDLACYGHPYARTPSLDRLAAEGTRFEQAYMTGVTCCPSRTGLMTGRFPASFAQNVSEEGFGTCPTVTDLLHGAGYRTGHFGKWHIGPTQTAGTYGIEETSGARTPRADDERGRDASILDAAIEFIERHQEQPFYVNVWLHSTHYPVDPPAGYVAKFDGVEIDRQRFAPAMQAKFDECLAAGGDLQQSMRKYLADVLALDDSIGRLMARLDELGLSENTIVVFSSDHGPAPVQSDTTEGQRARNPTRAARRPELNMLGYAGYLRGGKHQDYEGGVRVPFIVRWPGHVPAGQVDRETVFSGVDWLPTLCSLAGVEPPETGLDGEDLSQAWLGTPQTRTRPLFWKTQSAGSDPTIRDGQWKLHGSARRRGPVELYDLSVDPAERHNIADRHPEVVARLQQRLSDWKATLPQARNRDRARRNSRFPMGAMWWAASGLGLLILAPRTIRFVRRRRAEESTPAELSGTH